MLARVARVVFLGLDGGTMSVFAPWFDRGRLPNLAALWRQSATGVLRSTSPMVTPVAWSSFLTGCRPITHGVHEFLYVAPDGYSVRPFHAGEIRVPTLWEILDESNLPVISLNLAMTWPSREELGLIVGGAEAPGLDAAFAQCPEFGREVAARVPQFTNRLVWKRRPRSLEELRERSRRNQDVFRAQAEVAELADQRTDWAALMVHFHNLDGIQHRLWPYLDVDDTRLIEPGWNEEVGACLDALDESVGRLMELAAKRDAAVIALADHGFGPCRKVIQINGLLRQGGFQSRPRCLSRWRHRIAKGRDRLRRWRARRGAGVDVQVAKSVPAVTWCDWGKSLAYAPFGELSGHIYLNPRVAGRGESARRNRREVVEFLQDARDPETGLRLFTDAMDVAEVENVEPLEQGLPEILAPCTDGFHVESRMRRGKAVLAVDPGLPGTHYRDGVIAIQAPGFTPGRSIRAELEDLAPTTLALLGRPIPSSMEGRDLCEAFPHRKLVEQLADPTAW